VIINRAALRFWRTAHAGVDKLYSENDQNMAEERGSSNSGKFPI
jgi:hypothetical protein